MHPFAMVFPGQGSQQIGMMGQFATQYPLVKELFDLGAGVLGYDLWALTQKGPEEQLNQTEYTQPALLAAGVAIWQIWQQQGGGQPQLLAGHSLGEYTALVCGGSLAYSEALKLVTARGRLMQAAIPHGKGGMVVIVGLGDDQVNEVCQEASSEDYQAAPANYNSPGQVVIAGHLPALETAISLAKEKGAMLAKQLPVSVPSHSPLMKTAAEQLAAMLANIEIKPSLIPIIQNADVKSYRQPAEIKDALKRQLYNPVRWVETVQYLADQSMTAVIESGPGKILTGLNKRIVPTILTLAISDDHTLHQAIDYSRRTTCN